MKGLFFIKGVQAWVNPIQVSSIYRVGDSWHVAMANGSDYTISEDEYVLLLEACKPHAPEDKQDGKMFFDMLRKFIDENDKKED